MISQPPAYKLRLIDLPLCKLHVMEAGGGPPLVIVPATISELENWRDLVQFMAQWFHVYFFELPGHGLSSPFSQEFHSDLVAEVVEQLVDSAGIERFNLMGFSFGGVLAMKTFLRLQQRIDRLILLAPCLSHRALLLAGWQKWAVEQFNRLLKRPRVRNSIWEFIQSRTGRSATAAFICAIGKVEHQGLIEAKMKAMQPSLIEIITREVDEILTAEFHHPAVKHSTLCYFAMSVNDPLLHFGTTLEELRNHFSTVHVTSLAYPFHQPPRPFTFEELNRDFRASVQGFMLTA